jgi:hypothetical protein
LFLVAFNMYIVHLFLCLMMHDLFLVASNMYTLFSVS